MYAEIKESFGSSLAEMPTAATSDPKLESEMIAIARTIYEDGRVPAYISTHWFFMKASHLDVYKRQLYRMLITWQMASGDEAPCIVYEPEPFAFVAVPADVIINANFALFQAFPAQTLSLIHI